MYARGRRSELRGPPAPFANPHPDDVSGANIGYCVAIRKFKKGSKNEDKISI
nr:MAG TPA: hypothetical protein [Caudoviricetes sp.]